VSSHPALSADRLAPPTPGQLRRLLAAEHLRPRKALSQNFLTDAAALDAIVAAAELQLGDRVLEVGPGLGVLTRRLLAAGASVLAVELDPRLAAWLRRELAEVPGFDLIEADALTLHPREVFPAESFKLVANIPYHITSPLLHAFLEGERPPEVAVLLVQAEVAERVAAPPGQMSYLSVFVQNIASAEVVARVPAAAFEPAPDVDSAVLRLRRRAEPPVPLGSGREPFYRIVQAGFRQRRKQIHNGLGRELPVGGGAVENALAACAIDGERRPQTLSVEEWACLATQLTPLLRRADEGGTARAERHARRGTAG
jgi:16S rRNA (adenine1518-N6/adenine1519-N6)-dimethyltransferase